MASETTPQMASVDGINPIQWSLEAKKIVCASYRQLWQNYATIMNWEVMWTLLEKATAISLNPPLLNYLSNEAYDIKLCL